MDATLDDLDRLILDIHAAPLAPHRWQHVVETTRKALNADRAFLFSLPMRRAEVFWQVGSEMDPSIGREYAQEFAPEDVWMLSAKRRRAQVGLISTGEELIDRSEFLRTRFFNEFLARYEIDRFLNVLLSDAPWRNAPVPASLSFYRGPGRTEFGANERTLLARVAPHLVLALDSFWKTRALSLQNAVLSRTLDAVTVPLFVIDQLGHIVFANHLAETELLTGECLRIVDGCLAPSRAVRDPRDCLELLRGLRAGRAGTVMLTVGPSAQAIVLSTAPLSEAADTASWGDAAGFVWLAPAQSTANPVTRIADLFGLTDAEARLLGHLATGETLSEAAQARQVSIHTARSQLKTIQHKTGWHTQSELARMVQQFGLIDPYAGCHRPGA